MTEKPAKQQALGDCQHSTIQDIQKNVQTHDTEKKVNPLWGGRFCHSHHQLLEKINASISFDQRMAFQDIQGSMAHARMLMRQGILSTEEFGAISGGLETIRAAIENGKFDFQVALEDIHMNIESRLKDLIGDPAGKLHTARSRNDQVATDFKLWVRHAIDTTLANIRALQKAFLSQAESGADFIMPGFTHLQSAQPITWGHHMMAYVEMLERDYGRFHDARVRLNECPLGAAALAGTSFPVDRTMTAEELGFDRPTANSLDSVSDRDFALEFLSAASLCAVHLSRFAEEIVLWSTSQFGFIKLSDKFTTGSSIMPQKRNPDAAELIRAKIGRIQGALVGLLTVMKGLPLAYSKDMQEDKEPVFDAAESLEISLAAMTGMVLDMKPQALALYESALLGFSTATDLADYLVQNHGYTFREAHHQVGAVVKVAETRGIMLKDLPLEVLQVIIPELDQLAYKVFSVEYSVNSRTSYGGTAPSQVRTQIALWRKKLIG